ncbi:MAG: glycosyltransferase family 2 protein [Tepidisphaeraceae bacterium]
MNRLGIIEVLRGAWQLPDGRDLAMSVHAGDRNAESRGMRFIVKRSNQPLCCVKRLPLAGPYDTQAILATQKAYRALTSVKVPQVLSSTQDDRNWFIVEQFVLDGMRLDDAIRRRVLTRPDAEKLVAKILQEIYSNSLGPADPTVDEKRVLNAIEGSRLSVQQKASFRQQIFACQPPMWHPPVWTSRDFLPRNILLSEGQPFLVDFDLACKTGLLGMDVLRIEFYTGWQIPFWPAEGASRQDPRTHLLFLLLEEHLQRTIAAGSHYRYWVELYDPQIQQLVRRVCSGASAKRALKNQLAGAPMGAAAVPPAQRARRASRAARLHRAADLAQRTLWTFKNRIETGVVKIASMRTGIEALGEDMIQGRIRCSSLWKNIAKGRVKFWIDTPGEWTMPNESTLIQGWCYSTSSSPITAVRAVVNGQVHSGYYGGERQDVKLAHGSKLPHAMIGFAVQCTVQLGFNHVVLEALADERWIPVCRSIWRTSYFPDLRRRSHVSYRQYVEMEERRLNRQSAQYAKECDNFAIRPLISVVLPVYRTDLELLSKAVESVRRQIYGKWELCIVDDASKNRRLTRFLEDLAKDKRVKLHVREQNGNISAATNDAIALAAGEWIALLDHDDELSPDALYQIVAAINRKPDCDVLYTDQDKIDAEQNRWEPFFKPDWSPAYLRGVMYLGHLLVARRSLLQQLGGCDGRFDGVQDFELALRLSEHNCRIEHVPRILYHWRAIPGSVAADSWAKNGIDRLQEQAVQAHLDRLGVAAAARRDNRPHRVQIVPKPRSNYPKISILIPTRDHPELIGRCLKTLYRLTSYPNFEVLAGDNDTSDPRAMKILDSFPIRKVPLPGEFHFAQFINTLAAQATGDYLMLLNNDTEIVQADWLQHLLLYAQEDDVGMAGALLTYADGTVQHAGIILGPRGTADHVMRGFPADCDGYMGSLACTREVTAVTAAASMISRRKFMLVGGLCERFRRHYDDLDFCLRLRSRGWRNLCVASARLIHYESRSRGLKYDFTDRVLLLDRWESVIDQGDAFYSRNFDRDSTDYRVGIGGTSP